MIRMVARKVVCANVLRKVGRAVLSVGAVDGSGPEQDRGVMTGSSLPRERIAGRCFAYYPRLDRVRRYVEEHLDQPITVRDAARVACLEYKYFSVFFRSKARMTFSEWLRRVRVAKAVDLFCRQDIAISQAAYRVGFRSVRTFERSFKQVIGMTPRAFKLCVRPEQSGSRCRTDAGQRQPMSQKASQPA